LIFHQQCRTFRLVHVNSAELQATAGLGFMWNSTFTVAQWYNAKLFCLFHCTNRTAKAAVLQYTAVCSQNGAQFIVWRHTTKFISINTRKKSEAFRKRWQHYVQNDYSEFPQREHQVWKLEI
jgi:hypothetical protein